MIKLIVTSSTPLNDDRYFHSSPCLCHCFSLIFLAFILISQLLFSLLESQVELCPWSWHSRDIKVDGVRTDYECLIKHAPFVVGFFSTPPSLSLSPGPGCLSLFFFLLPMCSRALALPISSRLPLTRSPVFPPPPAFSLLFPLFSQ